MTDSIRLRDIAMGALGFLAFLCLWEVSSRMGWVGMTLPPFSKVMEYLTTPTRAQVFLTAAAATFSTAANGYVVGAITGLVAAMIGHLFVAARPGMERFASLINAMPQIAIAPIFVIFLGSEWAGGSLAALGTFFVVYVAASSGFLSGSPVRGDLFRAFGASDLTKLSKLDLLEALPSITTGLRQSVPIALFGAIIGEWFGARRGLGVLMLSSMQNANMLLLWSAVVVVLIGSVSLFMVFGLIEAQIYKRYS